MKQAVWTQPYDINTIVLNAQKRLGLFGLQAILQDAAWIHASHLGHGFEDMLAHGLMWMLTRHRLEMRAWPHWGERIEVRTWVRPISGALAHRDYEIWRGADKLGEAVSSWMTIDVAARRPVKPSFPDLPCRAEGCLSLEAVKIPLRTNLEPLAGFRVRNSDLDMNGHVNNTRYAQWLLDAVPAAAHAAYEVRDYEVNFLNEARPDDVVLIAQCDLEPTAVAARRLHFQGRREADDKPIFVARMGAAARG